jgi:hypothetical protein
MFLRICMLVSMLLFCLPARAQGPDPAIRGSARNLGEEANALFDEGQFAAALDKYERADALVHVPTLGLQAARCLERLGRWVEAAERYLAVTRMQLPADAMQVHVEAQALAASERDKLVPRIPGIVIELSSTSEGASVTIDGKPLPSALLGEKRLVDPGEHRVEGRLGEQAQTRSFMASEGQTSRIVLQFVERAPTPSVPAVRARSNVSEPDRSTQRGGVQRTLGIVVAGVGAVGLAAGGVTALVMSGKRSDLEEKCGAELECPRAAWSDADSYNGLRPVSGATLIGGAVCLIAGGVLYFTAPRVGATPIQHGRVSALQFSF